MRDVIVLLMSQPECWELLLREELRIIEYVTYCGAGFKIEFSMELIVARVGILFFIFFRSGLQDIRINQPDKSHSGMSRPFLPIELYQMKVSPGGT